jgi:ParB family chromosome partitioning protein
MVERRLGRGLDFLISGELRGFREDEIVQVPIDEIRANPFQPRHEFKEQELRELAASIQEHGLLQPILVRRKDGGYELVAGERRWRASQLLQRPSIPAVVRDADDTQMVEMALIENIQRENLNAMEVARGYQALIDRLGLTQQETADRLGKSRSGVANMLRLLELPRDLQDLVSRGTLSAGHARAILALPDPEARRELAHRASEARLSVREVEADVKRILDGPRPKSAPEVPPHVAALEERLRERLGTRVGVRPGKGEKGRIVIEYFSRAELTRIVELLSSGAFAAEPIVD